MKVSIQKRLPIQVCTYVLHIGVYIYNRLARSHVDFTDSDLCG